MQYNTAVYIGRFQPIHKGHSATIQRGLKVASNLTILIGSANSPRTPKNPWTFEERKEMILLTVPNKDKYRVTIKPLNDYLYEHQQWLRNVQSSVSGDKVCLIGHYKDDSSYYLKHFPNWKLVDMPLIGNYHSTDIRENYLWGVQGYDEGLADSTYEWLEEFSSSNWDIYNEISNEFDFARRYIKQWSKTPYPVIFQTVDAVVIQSAHILLIQRKDYPGKGLWALPGGFVNIKETLKDACIRELKEETRLKVPVPVLLGNIKKEKTFDAVDRSSRGRTITRAHLIELDDSKDLPEVRAADDAAKAQWFPLSEFYNMATMMYEDHYHIVRNMIDGE